MELKSILKKASYQIANPTYLEKAEYAMVCDIEKFAQAKIANGDIGAKIMAAISNPAVSAGLGAAAAGGGTYLASRKNEGEEEGAFKKRRILEMLTNGLAGAAVGGAIPIAAKQIKGIATPEQPSAIKSVGKGLLNKGLLATGGAGAGYGLDAWLHDSTKTEKVRSAWAAASDRLGVPHPDTKNLKDLANKVVGGTGGPIDDLLNAVKGIKNPIPSPRDVSAAASVGRTMDSFNKYHGSSILKRLGRTAPVAGAATALVLPFLLKKLDQVASS